MKTSTVYQFKYLALIIFLTGFVFFINSCKKSEDNAIKVTGISLDRQTLSIPKGNTDFLTATIYPANADNKSVVWTSSDSEVVEVNAGNLLAKKTGTATITTTTEDGSFTAYCQISVYDKFNGIDVESVTLNKSSLTIELEEEEQLQATVLPADATQKDLLWTSSDNTIVIVDNTGKITPVKKGTAHILVTTIDGGLQDKCDITVYKLVSVSDVNLTISALTLELNETEQLSINIEPDNATNPAIEWSSSNENVAKVSSSGIVTPVAPGTAIITATSVDGNHTDECTITVFDQTKVSGVSLDKGTNEIEIDKSFQLVAEVLPSTATNKNVIWSSSDSQIATVISNGTVTGEKAGIATISVTTDDGAFTASCVVTVLPMSVSDVELELSEITIEVAEKINLNYNVYPEKATNKNVIWKSDNENIVKVVNGEIEGISQGSTIVTIETEDGKYTDQCEVTVVKSVTGIKFFSDSYSITGNGYLNLNGNYTITPSDATNKEVTWKSSNTSQCTVSNGYVSKVSNSGSCTITVTTVDGNHKDTCIVNLYP